MSQSHPYRLLVGAMVVFVGYTAYLIAPASVGPLIAARFSVGTAGVGAAVSAAYVGWLAFQLPNGFLMDRYDNRTLLTVAVATFAVVAIGGAAVESYPAFLASRVVAGTGAGLFWGVGANVVGRTFPAGRRDVATGIFVASGPLGLAVGQFASPLLVERIGLEATFPAYAGLSVLGWVLFRSGAPGGLRQPSTIDLGGFARALLDRSVLLLALSGLCGNAAWLFVNAWMPTYGSEILALPLATVGALTALAPLAGAIARSSGGFAADRVGRRTTVVGSLLLVAPIALGFAAVSSSVGFAVVLLLSGFALQVGVGVYYVLVRDILGSEFSGTGIGAIATFQLTGGMLAPVVGGWLIEAASWNVAFVAVAGTAVVGAVVVLLVPAMERPTSVEG